MVLGECKGNNRDIDGLWWFAGKSGKTFDPSKPVMILIHGNSWMTSNSRLSTYWNVENFTGRGWNAAAYRWKDNNSPAYALKGKDGGISEASKLSDMVMEVINQTGYDGSEIRFTGFSWGVFVAAFAAKKLTDHIVREGRKILVTVDLIEPVPTRAADSLRLTFMTLPLSLLFPAAAPLSLMGSRMYTDDEGNRDWGDRLISMYLKHTAVNAVVKVRQGQKRFCAVYCAKGFSWSGCPWSYFPHCAGELMDGGHMEEKRPAVNLFDGRTWRHTKAYRLYTDCILSDHSAARYGGI